MEDLIFQFSFLSDQALQDKNFDPSTIEDLMKLFDIEAYKAWAAMELECNKEEEEAQDSMTEAEDYLDSVMESAMEEFRRFEEEMDRTAKSELNSLVQVGDVAKKMGKSMEKAATIASKKYVEAALNSATASMKSAWKGLNSAKANPCSLFKCYTVVDKPPKKLEATGRQQLLAHVFPGRSLADQMTISQCKNASLISIFNRLHPQRAYGMIEEALLVTRLSQKHIKHGTSSNIAPPHPCIKRTPSLAHHCTHYGDRYKT
ncbi:hypothetical protein Ancab_026891 [Ancistrocladus abbreviatus]